MLLLFNENETREILGESNPCSNLNNQYCQLMKQIEFLYFNFFLKVDKVSYLSRSQPCYRKLIDSIV